MKSSKGILSIEDVPGYAAIVWGGYLWINSAGNEQFWTKRPTKEQCESVTLEACQRLGLWVVETDPQTTEC